MRRAAAVDVGTNSVRLLVAEPGAPLHRITREMRITRLGLGIDAGGRFDDSALARTLDCIADYVAAARGLGAEAVQIAATSAVRDAADRRRFFDGVRDRTGIEASVLSGADEAATAFHGATSSVSGEPPYCVLDIGGGSTEFIVGDAAPDAATSRQLGCVRLTEQVLHGDPPTAAELAAADGIVAAQLDAVAADVRPERARTLVGLAGTVTTIGALHLGLPAYLPERIHGTRVPLDGVRRLGAMLAGMPVAERARLAPMTPGREDVIAAGALILQRVMERFGFADVLVSEADVLDGLVLRLLSGERGAAASG